MPNDCHLGVDTDALHGLLRRMAERGAAYQCPRVQFGAVDRCAFMLAAVDGDDDGWFPNCM